MLAKDIHIRWSSKIAGVNDDRNGVKVTLEVSRISSYPKSRDGWGRNGIRPVASNIAMSKNTCTESQSKHWNSFPRILRHSKTYHVIICYHEGR